MPETPERGPRARPPHEHAAPAAPTEALGGEPPDDGEWKTTLAVMFVAQFLSIIGFSFVLPFIPFYVRELGVTDEALVPVWAGILAAATGLMMTIFAPLWGWLSDRHGRKIMVERSMFAGAAVTVGMGLATDVYQLLVMRLFMGAMTGTISASLSLVSTTVPSRKLGFSLGLMQVAVFLGMSLGPWIGGVCADAFGYRTAFITGGAVLLAGGLLVLVGARERFVRPSTEAMKRNGTMGSLFACAGFGTMMAVFLLFNFSVHVAIPILPLFIETVGVAPSRIASTTGLLIAISGATGAVAAAGIGYVADRLGYKRLLIFHLILAGVLWLAHAAAQSVSQLIVIRFLYGLAAGGILPTMNALVGKLTPREGYGKAYGLTASMTSLGMTIGPLVGGVMASYLGYRWPMIFVGAALLAVVFSVVSRIPSR